MNKIINKITKAAKKTQFISFEYENSRGEKARYTIQVGCNYLNLVKRSVLELEAEKSSLTEESREAAESLIYSFNKTIEGEKINTEIRPSPYEPLLDQEGKQIKGVKIHKENRSLYVDGLLRSKVVIKTGNVEKNKGKKTKDFMRESLPVGNYRQFRLNNVSIAKLNGETLILK